MEEKLKLLVVDDESDNLDLLYRTFRRDFVVFKATSGAEALNLLDEKGEMAIIISDQRMPKMNGTELLSRTVERFPDTIRMVLTGYTDVEDLVSAINSGKVFKYITKPWNVKKLKVVVAQASETYRVIKQRTRSLSRALQQESLSNDIMSAVRGSLDYDSTLQTVVEALGAAFEADLTVIYPASLATSVQVSPEPVVYRAERPDGQFVFCADLGSLPTPPIAREITAETVTVEEQKAERIVVPLLDNDRVIATICLYKMRDEVNDDQGWTSSAVELLQHVAGQVALAISHAKLYQQIHLQSMKMRAELEVARKIQSNLLHQSWPEIPGIKIQARCQPAREVGGDFFEVFMHPQGDIWLAVGDVSGKGVPAALFMASAISVLRRELAQEKSPDPHKVMSNLNESLANDLMSNNYFITMALIRYSKRTGQLVYANAGHVYPVVWSHRSLVANREMAVVASRSGNSIVSEKAVEPTYLDVRGVPLGILLDWKATSGELRLTDGDVVLLTSDGITEATVPTCRGSGSCSMLNQEGLWDFLQQQPAELDLDNLLAYIHLPEGEQEDDQTILSLEVTSC
ncbi:MAG: fused response regulator/phosphatase [Leptolyngbya foveolarum]|uniref:Fused response regulator/phosphatase n=1 Tax=Leptolyngbya foveolarum TaxID=47253 RepID=A0A2W4TVL7_9CYAN|nr:MAG: fused response regulator/phosphatase [Leptolyngbya foveolarum]